MQARPGEELSCRAHNYEYTIDNKPVMRGVISYYAAQALSQATTVESWLSAINQLVAEDMTKKRLSRSYQPNLQITGEAKAMLPGSPPTVK